MEGKATRSCSDTEKRLKEQLAVLKKNRDNVPLEILKTKYKKGFTALCEELRDLTSDFVKNTALHDISVVPQYLPDVVQIIESAIADSGLLKECSRAVFRHQNFDELKALATQLREIILSALEPFYQNHMGVYIAAECLEEPYPPPYLYNFVTDQYYNGEEWVRKQPINF